MQAGKAEYSHNNWYKKWRQTSPYARMTAQEQVMLKRATSNQGYHYFGSARFFILLGKSLAETMQQLIKK